MIRMMRQLARGENDFPIIARSKFILAGSCVALLISVLSLGFRGFDFGIEFEGGSLWVAPITNDVTDGDVRAKVEGVNDADIQFVTEGGQRKVRVSSKEADPALVDRVKASLEGLPGSGAGFVEVTSVGPSWGAEISRKAVQALIMFLVGLTIAISLRFEWKMAIAALSALFHDLVITAGVYSLVGFVVTPAAVIALLTILGYSLYDTVVVFDKVQENTALMAQAARRTYADTVNASLNQVLMRSLNTSLASLLPVGALLFVGVASTAAQTLKDFALALFVGLLASTYSSIFFATPILVMLKEREPRYRLIRERIETKTGREAPATGSVRSELESLEAGREEDGEPVTAPVRAAPASKTAARARPRPAGSRPRTSGRKPGGRKRK